VKIEFINNRAKKELRELGNESVAYFERVVELMKIHGTFALGMPHVRKIQHPLWEIRMQDRQGISRAIFVSVVKNEVLVLHAFRKKTQQTPQAAIDLALKRLKQEG
jgi:phage-related protein